MAYIYNFNDTWNSAGTEFAGIGLDVTNTASSAASRLINLKVGGTSQFTVDVSGNIRGGRFYPSTSTNNNFIDNAGGIANSLGFTAGGSQKAVITTGTTNFNAQMPSTTGFLLAGWNSGTPQIIGGSSGGGGNSNRAADPVHFYSGAGTGNGSAANMAWFLGNTGASGTQENPYVRSLDLDLSSGASQFRVYNTYTDASNYERAKLSWSGSVFTFGTEAAGTGVKRGMEIDSANFSVTNVWNNAGTVFDGIKLNVTDTASNGSSKLLDLQIGGSSKLNVAKDGSITMYRFGAPTVGTSWVQHQFLDIGDPQHRWLINGAVGGAADVTGIIVGPDRWLSFPTIGALSPQTTSLRYGASGTIDQRAGGHGASGTTAQSYRLYNTYTDASNYERAKLSWGSNVLTIGTEAAGTGTKRNIVIDSANRSAYIASPTAEQIRDILISFGLMAPS